MGNILIDGNGNALISGNKALEVTSAIDSNIVPGNIKKDVSILGVTGTYEGSGGGGSITIDSTPTSGSSNAVSSGGVYTALAGKENTSNKVTSLSSSSTDAQYPSAKCVYDIVGDIQTALETILGDSDDPTPSSYTFTINGTSYQSEAGMNWAQWINSAYNTDYFYLYNNVVESAAGDSICDHYGDLVYGNDLIVNGEAYSD